MLLESKLAGKQAMAKDPSGLLQTKTFLYYLYSAVFLWGFKKPKIKKYEFDVLKSIKCNEIKQSKELLLLMHQCKCTCLKCVLCEGVWTFFSCEVGCSQFLSLPVQFFIGTGRPVGLKLNS